MDAIIVGFTKAIEPLLGALVVWFIWRVAREASVQGNFKANLLKGFLYCAVFALIAGLTLGNSSCIEYDDPIYGHCIEYANDGHQPTLGQQTGIFVFWLLLLYVPVALGVYSARKGRLEMSVADAEELVQRHQDRRYTESPLPASVGRMRQAYLTYISNKIAQREEFTNISMDDLIQGYVGLEPTLDYQPLTRFGEIIEFITECKKRLIENTTNIV